MREYLKGTFEQENFKVFEIQSKKKTSKDLQLDKVIIIIFLLFFILYSLFIVAFR